MIGVERVEEYVFWAVTGAVGLLISALTFFVKRRMDKKDARDKEQDKRITDFHTLKATLDRLADRLLMYALDLGNFLDALSENDVGINPAALDLRQRVECIP